MTKSTLRADLFTSRLKIRKKAKSFPSLTAHKAALISVS